MSMRYTSLKALQRPPCSAPAETTACPTLLGADGTSPHTVRPDVERLAQVLGATTKTNHYGEFLSVRCWCAQPPSFSPDPRALKGLSGGSGTYPFLVGIGWWEGGGLEIEQLFMREYSEERALLFALRERIAEHPVVVTFNGKSFDWPLLETRYRMTRKICVPTPRAHLDFLHPARHLWRLRLGSVRLSELERHVLGWDRGADLLSGLIPQIYFDYLRGGPPERMVPVLNHNQLDLRGLAALSSRILSLLSDAETLGRDGLELFGVSRICEKRGEDVRARSLYEKSIASFLPIETDRVARRSLARLAKRQGDFELACELWKGALGNSRHGYEAFEQLAIYYERKARDPEQAREIVRQALDELRRAIQMGDIAPGPYRDIKARFDHRMERLGRKSQRPLLDSLVTQTQA